MARTKLTPTNERNIKTLLAARKRSADELAIVKAELDGINAELLKIATTLDGAKEVWEGEDSDGNETRVTVVRSTTTVIDEQTLKSLVTPKVWRAITEEVVNRKAFESAVVEGAIDGETVDTVVTYEDRKPYVKVTVK